MFKIFSLFLLVLLLGCAGPKKSSNVETIVANVYIYKIYTGKYTTVNGYFMYRGLQMYIDNGSSGYYYKKYKLYEGMNINTQINVYHNYEGNRLILSTSDLNLKMYEIQK